MTNTITKERRDAIRAAAEKATPGPWETTRKFELGPRSTADDQSLGFVLPIADVFGDRQAHDLTHIANCDPQTILALLDALDAAEAKMGKPVAWALTDVNGNISQATSRAGDAEAWHEIGYVVRPLYAVSPAAEPVKVEPLEFDWAGEQCTVRYAASRGFWVGYRIGLRADGRKALHIERIGNEDRIGDYAEWEEAEAAAQADYDARIRSALVSEKEAE